MKIFPVKDRGIELCLCSRCASVYYASKDHFIERCEAFQVIHEPCQICLNPYGYDFRINVRIQPKDKKSTFETPGSQKVQSRQRGGTQQ
jgi:hypothetical protein